MTPEERHAAVDRAIAHCEEHGGVIDAMRDFVLIRTYDTLHAAYPDRIVRVLPAAEEDEPDPLCPHGIPLEFCGNCHEEEEETPA